MIVPDAFAQANRHRRRLPGVSREVALVLVASILLPLGFLIIMVGWYGTANTPYVFEQMPYLLSGGLLGLAMSTSGALLFFGSWVARGAAAQRAAAESAAAEQRAANDEIAEYLIEIRNLLASGPRSGQLSPAAASNGHNEQLVATAGGSMLHRRNCRIVAGRPNLRPLTTASGLQPCGLCNPLDLDTADAPS